MRKKKMPLKLAPPATGAAPVSAPNAPETVAVSTYAAEAAETARREAWDLSAVPCFADLALFPWSHERHSLAARLIAGDIPGPSLDELQSLHEGIRENKKFAHLSLGMCVDLLPYVATAEKVLYLAAHDFSEFAHLRGGSLGRFFSAIAEWSARAITPDLYEEACLCALRIITQHRVSIAIAQPRKGSGGSVKN